MNAKRWLWIVPALLATQAWAQKDPFAGSPTMICKEVGAQPMIPQGLAFVEAADRTRVLVYDGFVKKVYGHAIPVQVEEDTDAHVVFSWTVRDFPVQTNHGAPTNSDLAFAATYVRGSTDLFLDVRFVGYDNPPYSGQLSCHPR